MFLLSKSFNVIPGVTNVTPLSISAGSATAGQRRGVNDLIGYTFAAENNAYLGSVSQRGVM